MTEVPEHLLKKAAEARARLSGQAPPDAGDAASSAGDAPAASAPVPAAAAAPTPAVPEEPKAPEPVAPYVEAANARKKVPVWIIPVLVFLPFWAIYYVGYLENPPVEPEGLAFEGEEIYTAQCAGCHGGGGGGGSGRQLNGGEVLLTFPSAASGADASPTSFTVAPARFTASSSRGSSGLLTRTHELACFATNSATDDCWIRRPLPITIKSCAMSDISDSR